MVMGVISEHRKGGRQVDFSYLRQVAQAADDLGYFGVLLPTGRSCEDLWVIASRGRALAPAIALSGGSATWSGNRHRCAARMTATLDRVTGGRLLINRRDVAVTRRKTKATAFSCRMMSDMHDVTQSSSRSTPACSKAGRSIQGQAYRH